MTMNLMPRLKIMAEIKHPHISKIAFGIDVFFDISTLLISIISGGDTESTQLKV
jgi:hypothetical protein